MSWWRVPCSSFQHSCTTIFSTNSRRRVGVSSSKLVYFRTTAMNFSTFTAASCACPSSACNSAARAFSVACYLYPIVFIVNNAVAQSAQPIISFNHGAGISSRVRKAFRLSLRTAAVCGALQAAFLAIGAKPLVSLFLQVGTKPYEFAVAGLPLFAVSSVFFALNVAIIGYYQAIEQNARATVYMLLRGFVFLIPAFVLMPMLVSPQGLWLAVPVSEILTFAVILLSWQRK